MPNITAPPGRWEELGNALQRRRVDLSPRYKDRSAFARDTGVNDRMLGDLERARRTAYRDTSLRAVEIAYQLQEEAIGRFVTGKVSRLEVLVESSDADPQPAPAPQWDGEIVGPQGVVDDGEVLMWRDTPTGRLYRLVDVHDTRPHGEYEFPPEYTPEQVIDALRRMLALHRAIIGEMDREMGRRRVKR